MAAFLSETTLRDAVDRLGESRAAPRLADYLVFKRAQVRTANPTTPTNGAIPATAAASAARGTGPVRVTTGTKSQPFVNAIEEMALCVPRDQLGTWDHQPYFQPFAAKRDKARGYKSAKYPSNGPDNTAAGWQTMADNPVRLLPGTSPREWEIVPRTAQEYESFLLLRSAGEKPRILDAACWWLRFAPFDSSTAEADLVARFVRDLDLSATEQSAIFDPITP